MPPRQRRQKLGKGYRVGVEWGKVRDSCRGVLERWFGAENRGRGGLVLAPSGLSSGSGLTADSSVLTLTLAFLDFGLDFAQSFPFHAQFSDLFTKALSEDRFKYLVRRLGMRCLTPDELEVLAIESA
ncbi:hypothetical protein Tco_0671011 [Tanacetum coccineum]